MKLRKIKYSFIFLSIVTLTIGGWVRTKGQFLLADTFGIYR